eukprot:gene14575-biopygen11337
MHWGLRVGVRTFAPCGLWDDVRIFGSLAMSSPRGEATVVPHRTAGPPFRRGRAHEAGAPPKQAYRRSAMAAEIPKRAKGPQVAPRGDVPAAIR